MTAARGRAWRWLLAGAAALAALLAVTQLSPFLGDYGDDAEFLILGQGLAAGQGYAWVNSPEHPAHNRYPPGYPLLLAVAFLPPVGDGSAAARILPAKLLSLASLAGAGAACWLIARRRLPRPWAAAATALFLLNPIIIRFATQVMSDVPYLLPELVALAWADQLVAPQRAGSRWRWAFFGLLLAAGTYVRSAGVATAAGALAWALLRNRRGGVLAAATFALGALPWWLRDLSLAGGWRYLQEFSSAQYADPAAGTIGASGILERALGNGVFLVTKPGALGLPGYLAAVAGAAVCALGWWRLIRQHNGAAEWVIPPLMAAVLLWPIRTGRYLLPVVPLAGIYAVAGALAAAAALGRWRASAAGAAGPRRYEPVSGWLTAAVAAGLGLALLAEAGYAALDSAANLRALAGGSTPAEYYRSRPDWAHYLAAAAWLRAHAGPTDVAMARRHFALYVYSGHFTEKYRYDTSDEELAYLLSGHARKYVVEDAFEVLRGDFEPLPAALRQRGGDLLLRFQTADPPVRVWELVRPCCAAE